jgi:hypothetical protein
MDIKDVGKLIAKEAPLLGGIIGSVNPIAGLIINAVAHLFGADSSNPDDIASKINSDPTSALKLKQLELQHAEVLQQNAVDDRKSARLREENIIRLTGRRDSILDYIAFVVIAGYFFFSSLILFVTFNDTTYHIVLMMVGQLTNCLTMVLSYYFGASNK